ncbi:hypothetical protein [Paracidobacterium acidisoli]|uniref:Uncharacterized protein n=1 Tax=Paracidobacterium acidisoli TaxID=2303751 RepID=A0A372IR19_9BACT|nr:hypothetical protein [Paracidobacterium acidisoli]MBT9330217.1 hypothetical protein [Paracidobacterium acidisoli]
MFNVNEEIPSVRPVRILGLMGIAALLVAVVIAGYVFWNKTPPSAEGKLLQVRVYRPQLRTDNNSSGEAAEAATDQDGSLVILTPVRISNVGQKPLNITEMYAVLKMGNSEYRSFDISASDFPRVFKYYPELSSFADQQPVLRNTTLQPGAAVQGLLIFNYPLSFDQWNQRQSFKVTISFAHAKDLVLTSVVPGELATTDTK